MGNIIVLEKDEDSNIIEDSFQIDNIFKNVKNENCILITGQVQSGKTRTIINIIDYAVNKYDYNVIILLGGYNKILLNQTDQRLRDELECKLGKNFEIIKWNNEEVYLYRSLYNVLKYTDNLTKLYDLIVKAKVNEEQKSFEGKHKILIIDDEADFFSINKNKVSPSSTNKILKEIYKFVTDNFDDSLYINVTATPYANLFHNQYNEFEIQAIYTLPINEQYCGWEFFNSNPKTFLTNDFFFVRNDEKIKYSRLIMLWLMQTLKYFENENPKHKASQMIIFEEIVNDEHKNIYSFINELFSLPSDIDIFKNAFNEIKAMNIDEYHQEIYWSDVETLINHIKNNKDSIVILNSENESTIKNQEHDLSLTIYIGGFLLSRGVTFENLLVEYFAYTPIDTKTDTLLQRCRWFGYRHKNNMSKYMKIICTEENKKNLDNCKKPIRLFFNEKTKNGSKLDINLITQEILSIKKMS